MRREKGADILQAALGDLELASRDIQEGCSALLVLHDEAAEEVVLLDFQHILSERNARSDNLGDAALDEFLGKFRVLQLVADRNFVAGTDQFRQVALEGMVRKSGHGNIALVPIRTLCLDESQDPGRGYRIVRIGLIEIAYAIQQYSLGVLRLDLEELLHHWGVFRYLCHITKLQLSF